MTLTFENDNDVIVFALERIISFARENRYLFVANCIWWIAGVIGLEAGLINHIDNLESRRHIYKPREISSTPRDIAQGVSPEESNDNYIPDPLPRTWKGRIGPTPKSRQQLKKARRLKRKEKTNPKLQARCKAIVSTAVNSRTYQLGIVT
jgi:hypothetical protein